MIEQYINRLEFESYEDFQKNFKFNIPSNFNFGYNVVDGWAKIQPDKPALIWENDQAQEKTFTFSEIKTLSDKAANVFTSHGIKKGDVVLLMLMERPEVWISLVALQKIGAIAVPATYQLTEKDIIYRCKSANVKMIVCADNDYIISNINKSRKDCPSVQTYAIVSDHKIDGFVSFRDEITNASTKWEKIVNNNNDIMLIYFSSGTTGMPKMVAHDFTYPIGQIVTAKFWHCVDENSRHMVVADSGWAKFGWGKIYGQWIAGAAIVAFDAERFSPAKMLEFIEKKKITSFCAPPTVYRFLLKEDLSKHNLSSIKHFSVAGEPLNPEILEKMEGLLGTQIHEGFGQSETTVIVGYFGNQIKIKPGSMGKPAPIYNVDIFDEHGCSCEDGVVGALVIKNLNEHYPTGLLKEYYLDDAANEKAFVNNTYYTGDTAWRDSDGYYWFVGRSDDVIKCSGYRIGPYEVESALFTHPAVLECAVTAVPDEIRGQVVKATIVLSKGFSPSEQLKKEIQEHVKSVTAPYKYPRVIDFVCELPKTASGKIKRNEIRIKDNIH